MAHPTSSTAPTPMTRTPYATTPSAPPNPTNTTKPPIPPPQTFDILPPLHELLARIEHTTPNTSSPPATTDPTTASLLAAHYADLPPLDPKDLPTEALALKGRIRNALRELGKLPDMERGIEEQRAEIEALEERVARQRALVERLGVLGEGMRGVGSGE